MSWLSEPDGIRDVLEGELTLFRERVSMTCCCSRRARRGDASNPRLREHCS
jgi:hypothetical protein